MDLSQVDQELATLGEPPEDLAALIERYGEADRSLEHLDEVLSELGAGARLPAAPPKRAPAPPESPASVSGAQQSQEPQPSEGPSAAASDADETAAAVPTVSHDTLVDAPAAVSSLPPPFDLEALEAETALLSGGADAAAEALPGSEPLGDFGSARASSEAERPPPAATEPPTSEVEEIDGFLMAELDDEAESVFSREQLANLDAGEVSEALRSGSRPPSEPAQPPEPFPDVHEAETRLTSSLPARGPTDAPVAAGDNPLDQALDPNDFPQTPSPPAVEASRGAEVDDDDFELLVDEDDIIEIDGEDLEILD